jgi:coatomer subunit gamma
LFAINPDAIKRLAPEAQQIFADTKEISQFHAANLIYLLRSNDAIALQKMVKDLLQNAHPLSMLFALSVYEASIKHTSKHSRGLVDLKPLLRLQGKYNLVSIAASRVILKSEQLSADHTAAIANINSYLSSKNLICRFTALRLLGEIAHLNASSLVQCIPELEHLIASDVNKTLSTLAIAVLLKLGSETSIEGLLKRLDSLSTNSFAISDDFRLLILDALKELCIKFPSRSGALLDYLGKSLRDESGVEFKATTIDVIFEILNTSTSSSDDALCQLGEFIEDSDHALLTILSLKILGTVDFLKRAKHSTISLIIRCVANRIILEETDVRLASIKCLSNIASQLNCKDASEDRHLINSIKQIFEESIRNDESLELVQTCSFYLGILRLPKEKANEILRAGKFVFF